MLARAADPATDPVLAAAGRGRGRPGRAARSRRARWPGWPELPAAAGALAAPRRGTRWSRCSARARPPSPVWEALDQEGLVSRLLPDWERVRNRPAAQPAAHLHRGPAPGGDRRPAPPRSPAAWPGPTCCCSPRCCTTSARAGPVTTGSPARWWPGTGRAGSGSAAGDADLVAGAVRHHLLLPQTATRRDLDDPVTVAQVAAAVGGRPLLELLHALAEADGLATGPAAWNDWKAGLVGDLVRRVGVVAGAGEAPRRAAAAVGRTRRRSPQEAAPAARLTGPEVTVVAPDRPGPAVAGGGRARLAPAGGALRERAPSRGEHGRGRLHRGAPSTATRRTRTWSPATCAGPSTGRLDVAERLRAPDARLPGAPAPVAVAAAQGHPARRRLAARATVVEVRAHDAPGLLWRIGRALGRLRPGRARRPGWRRSAPRRWTSSTWWTRRRAGGRGSGGKIAARSWRR